MQFISLFAGVGGIDLGLERAGMTCVAQVEIDEFCQRVLKKHWQNVPKYKDVLDVGKHNLPTAKVICGGFPCQDVSVAGKRAGLEGHRSTLWSEYYRIICEIRPKWVIVENVIGLLSANQGGFFTKILREISEAGYDAEWFTIRASDLGAPHQRERVFIVAYPNGNRLEKNTDNHELCDASIYQGVARRLSKVGGTSVWDTTRPIGCRPMGVGDGISARLDKFGIKAMGNAVVPQVAQVIGETIMSIENGA